MKFSVRRQFSLFVLLAFISPNSALATPEFIAVPESCATILRAYAGTTSIDWTDIVENMKRLGYPEHIAKTKLQNIRFDAAQALEIIRAALEKEKWQFGQRLSSKDAEAIGIELANWYANTFLETLPFWAAIPHFRLQQTVYSYMQHTDLDDEEQLALMQFAPLWLKGRLGLQNAKLFLQASSVDSDEQYLDLTWLTKHLPAAAGRQISNQFRAELNATFNRNKAFTARGAQIHLQLATIIPWSKLTTEMREVLQKWINLRKYQPLRTNSIQLISRGFESAGDCEYMANGHIESLGLDRNCKESDRNSRDFRRNVFIKVNGHVVGSLKRVGNPSMIALRNVVDEDGRLVLAMGGVYHVAKDIYDKLSSRNNWEQVEVDSLQIHPKAFMLNVTAWSEINISKLVRMISADLSRDELVDLLDKAIDGDLTTDNAEAALHEKLWQGLLAKLNQLRLDLEK